jgi:hypothetical protein
MTQSSLPCFAVLWHRPPLLPLAAFMFAREEYALHLGRGTSSSTDDRDRFLEAAGDAATIRDILHVKPYKVRVV